MLSQCGVETEKFPRNIKNPLLPYSTNNHFLALTHASSLSSTQTIHQSRQSNYDDFPGREPFHPKNKDAKGKSERGKRAISYLIPSEFMVI